MNRIWNIFLTRFRSIKNVWIIIFLVCTLLFALVFADVIKNGWTHVADFAREMEQYFVKLSASDEENDDEVSEEDMPTKERVFSRETADSNAIAEISSVLGEVRLKRAFSPTWYPIYSSTELKEGDQIYSGSFSAAKIQYFSDGTQLNLSGYSLLRIGLNPPERSTYSKDEISNLPYIPPKGGSSFSHLLKNSKGQIPRLAQSNIESLRRKSNLMDKIVILGMSDKVMIYSSSYPAPFAVKLEKFWSNTTLWAYLWDQNAPGGKPVWTGSSKGSFSSILIPRPGVYTMIIQSEDRDAESPRVEIAAFSRSANSLDLVDISSETNQNLTVVYQ